jgi:hypothetical protein
MGPLDCRFFRARSGGDVPWMGPMGLMGPMGTDQRHTSPIGLMSLISPIRGMRKGCTQLSLLPTAASPIEDEDDDEYEDERPPPHLSLLTPS